MGKVVVAQYHSEIRSLMLLLLRQCGYDVQIVNDLAEIRQQSLQHELGLLCLDIMFPGVEADNPLELFRSGDMGATLAEIPILLTDVNGLLETTNPGETFGADGFYAPRTGRSRSFLEEVRSLLPLSPETPVQKVFTWRLDKNELPSFIFACFLFGLNGILTLNDNRIHKSLHFVDGWIRSASSSVESDWLGKMLLTRHMITPKMLNEVERALTNTPRRIGEEFIARGFLDEKKLQEALNQQYASIAMSVFEWDCAEITLSDGDPNPAPHLMIHPSRLILAGLNLAFSEKEVDKLLPPLEHYLSPTIWTSFRFAEVDLNREEKMLLLSIDGQRKVEALVSSSPFPPESTKKFLLTLLTMRAVVASDQPEELPITFSRQIEGDAQSLIEDAFFNGEEQRVITFDDLTDFEEEEENIKVDPDKPITLRERFALIEHLAAARYLVAVVLVLMVFAVLFALYLQRDVAMHFEKEVRMLESGRTEVLLIKKPRFEKADRLLVEAVYILKEKGWGGLSESLSLIGGALDIDPAFNEAMNFHTSIEMTLKAKEAIDDNQQEEAYDLLDQAMKLFPDNPLALRLMEQVHPPEHREPPD